MNTPFSAFLLVLTSVFLASCVTVYEPMPVSPERTYSAVISHSDAFRPRPGETFSWFTDAIVVSDGDSGVSLPQHVQALIAETLETALIAKGFRVADSPNSADFLIGAAVLRNDSDQNQAMRDFIQVFPAIRETLDKDQPASLLVAAGRPANLNQHHLMWRGAVNASVVVKEIPDAEQQARIKELVESLVKQFP